MLCIGTVIRFNWT